VRFSALRTGFVPENENYRQQMGEVATELAASMSLGAALRGAYGR
jgi:hypothetical protein